MRYYLFHRTSEPELEERIGSPLCCSLDAGKGVRPRVSRRENAMTMIDVKAEIVECSYARILCDEQFRFAGLELKGHRLSRNGFRVVKEQPEKVVWLVG